MSTKRQAPIISKSSFMAGLKCPKLLWHKLNDPEAFPEPDAASQAILHQGTAVGLLARQLFPEGIEIGRGIVDKRGVDELSRAALPQLRPLFEAGFITGRAYARADVLVPVGRKQWDLIEVKSSTKVKDEHILDVILQRYVYQGAGLSIRRCFVMHLDRGYVRRGELDPTKLFVRRDITKDVEEPGGPERKLEQLARVVAQRRPPRVKIGPHCTMGCGCPLVDLCWKPMPKHSVFRLTGAWPRAFDWYHRGFLRLQDLPPAEVATRNQAIQIEAVRTRRPHVDSAAIAKFLGRLEYPLYFLDVDAVRPGIPLWDRTSPYQLVPFQLSVDRVREPGGRPAHRHFLAEGSGDPRPALLARLKSLLGKTGSVVIYSSGCESRVLQTSAAAFPAFATWWRGIERRVVDLRDPFRDFHCYHPKQLGSAALRLVLPALTGRRYHGLKIGDRDAASLEYLRITFGRVSGAERWRVRVALEKYSAFVTAGMVEVARKLENLLGHEPPESTRLRA